MRWTLGVALSLGLVTSLSSHAAGQPAGVWFAVSPTEPGAPSADRFELAVGGAGTVIRWAPFGKTPVSWGSIALRPDSSIEFHWAGDPSVVCVLRRTDPSNYGGACRGPEGVARQLTLTMNQPPNGFEFPASEVDFRILKAARNLLSGQAVWNRHDDRYCEDDAAQRSWSLFCALYQASVDVAGRYLHRQPLMMELRAVVGEVTHGRTFEHILRDYNNLDSTTYAAIAEVFDRTDERLRMRQACADPRGWEAPVDRPHGPPVPGANLPRPVIYWSEYLAHTVAGRTFYLVETLGPMTTAGTVPADWLAASTAPTQRTWKRGQLGGVDARGELPNGNRWRYFSQCGESRRYHDVPAGAAAFFDRMIDGVYVRDWHADALRLEERRRRGVARALRLRMAPGKTRLVRGLPGEHLRPASV